MNDRQRELVARILTAAETVDRPLMGVEAHAVELARSFVRQSETENVDSPVTEQEEIAARLVGHAPYTLRVMKAVERALGAHYSGTSDEALSAAMTGLAAALWRATARVWLNQPGKEMVEVNAISLWDGGRTIDVTERDLEAYVGEQVVLAVRGSKLETLQPSVEPLETFNRFLVTAKDEQVLMLLSPAPKFAPEEALQLAAWLVVGAELAGYEHPLEKTVATVKAIVNA